MERALDVVFSVVDRDGSEAKEVEKVVEGLVGLERAKWITEDAWRLPEVQEVVDEGFSLIEKVRAQPDAVALLEKLKVSLQHDELRELGSSVESEGKSNVRELVQDRMKKMEGFVQVKSDSDSGSMSKEEALEVVRRHSVFVRDQLRYVRESNLLDATLEFVRAHEEILEPKFLPQMVKMVAHGGKERDDLIDSLSERFLNFLSAFLPKVTIPAIEGEREGVNYVVDNLTLTSLILRKEHAETAFENDISKLRQGAPFFVLNLREVEAKLSNVDWSFQQNYFPHLQGKGKADVEISKVTLEISVQLVKTGEESLHPNLKFAGCEASIEHLDVQFKESNMSWLLHLAGQIVQENLQVYLVSLLQDKLTEHAEGFSVLLNRFISTNWETMSRFVDLNLEHLPKETIASDYMNMKRVQQFNETRRHAYTVSFHKTGTIGLIFAQSKGYVIVKGFRQTEDGMPLPAERSGEIIPGDVLVAFNGQTVTSLPLERVLKLLKRAGRPLHLTFVPCTKPVQASVTKRRGFVDVMFHDENPHLEIVPRWKELDSAESHHGDAPFSLLVKRFGKKPDGSAGPAEACGEVAPGMIVSRIDGKSIRGVGFDTARKQLVSSQKRPLALQFAWDSDFDVLFENELPNDARLDRFEGLLIVSGFKTKKGSAELQCGGNLTKGMVVSEVNGQGTSDMDFRATIKLMKTASRPMTVVFQGIELVFKEKEPLGIIFFKNKEGKAAFKAFSQLPGPIKAAGVEIGHALIRVGDEARPEFMEEALKKASLPISLRFRDLDHFEELMQ